MKRHSYDIYDSNVMRDSLSKLETDFRGVNAEQEKGKHSTEVWQPPSIIKLNSVVIYGSGQKTLIRKSNQSCESGCKQ